MDNKLQELTDRLYKEGLSKGKEEGEAILAEASRKAEEIIAAAKKEADAVLRDARKEAEDFRTKVEGDVKMAATQSIQAVRNDIENLMVGKLTDSAVNASLADVEFIKEAIKAVAMNFNAQEAVDLEAVLRKLSRANSSHSSRANLPVLSKAESVPRSQRRCPEASTSAPKTDPISSVSRMRPSEV